MSVLSVLFICGSAFMSLGSMLAQCADIAVHNNTHLDKPSWPVVAAMLTVISMARTIASVNSIHTVQSR